jgi:hypothetical protein
MSSAVGSDDRRAASMSEVLPPHVPNELELPDGAGEALQHLKRIWLRASPDSIGRDLELARELAASVPPSETELAQRYVIAIGRLERWLRDR